MRIDFEQPYSSARSPICADNLVATSQPLATQAGIQAMRRGGNAVDAAVAAAVTLTVVEPTGNGVGSDAFAIVAAGGRIHGLNASGRSPAAWNAERFRARGEIPTYGWDAVTVPGAVSAWMALSERFGELSFYELFEDAIALASEGFLVGPITARAWKGAFERYAEFSDFAEHFGPVPSAGTRFRRPALAKSLRDIAESGGHSFYSGDLAARIAAASSAAGGAMTRSDLADHRADWVDPLKMDYLDHTIHELPPNGQGLGALIALGILRELGLDRERDTVASYHYQIEAMKIGIRAAFDHIADPEHLAHSPAELLDPEVLAKAASTIGERASGLPPVALPESHGTVYLTTADRHGNMVSLIQSNYMGFGSGIVIPDTGIALQNRARGFTLEEGHPNEIGPRKRPYQTIIPGFVTQGDEPRISFGIMGGHMQHQGHVQLIDRVLLHDQNPQAAIDAPRWHVDPDFVISLEPETADEIREGLLAKGHSVEVRRKRARFGGAQMILATGDGYVGGSDSRKEGQAAGF